MYIAMFFTDLSLFYLLPLLLFVILHSLIAAVLLRSTPRTESDNRTNEDKQQRNQVRWLFSLYTFCLTSANFIFMSKYYFKYNLSGGGRSSCDVNLSQRKSYKKLVEIEHNFYIAMYSGCQDAGDHCRSVCSIVVTAEVRAFLFIRFYSVFFFFSI